MKAWMLIALTLGSTTPVWLWTAQRAMDGSDEPWGLVALLAVIALTTRRSRARAPGETTASHGLLAPGLTLVLYSLSYAYLPHLLSGVVANTALGLVLSRLYFGRSLQPGIWGLLLLGLPLIASLQFYLGYPLRLAVAQLAAPVLRLAGCPVEIEGVGLRLGERLVMVDGPCSGVKMLWVGCFITCLVAARADFGWWRSGLALASTVVLVVAGNALRASSLFYVEVGIFEVPDAVHSAAGLVVFALTACLILALMIRLAPREETPCAIPGSSY